MKNYLVGLNVVDCDGENLVEVNVEAIDSINAQSLALEEVKCFDNTVSVEYVKSIQ